MKRAYIAVDDVYFYRATPYEDVTAPTPLQDAKSVRSIYSNHFAPFTYFWAGNWYQKTQMQDLVVAPGARL